MQRQFVLWPEAERPLQELNIWKNLDPEMQAMVISILSRLIRKAVSPKTQEDNHER